MDVGLNDINIYQVRNLIQCGDRFGISRVSPVDSDRTEIINEEILRSLQLSPETHEHTEIYQTINEITNITGSFAEKQVIQIQASPQVRKVAANTTIYVPIYIVPYNFQFELRQFSWECFTSQGYQDLVIQLTVGNFVIGKSGKVDSTVALPPFPQPTYVVENRPGNTSSLPPTELSSAAASGFPDNYSFVYDHAYGVGYESELITFLVQNQSSVYPHGVRLYMRGVAYPIKAADIVDRKVR